MYCRVQFAYFFFEPSPEDILIDFREEGREGERERNIDVRKKRGICPDWELNQQPFTLQNDTEPT